MLTQNQLLELAKYFQIDTFTVFREYLQLIFLSYLYRQKQAEKIYFKGGTAIHLLFDSPRFSEDLDFTTEISAGELKELIIEIETSIQNELPDFKIKLVHKGLKTARFKIINKSPDFKYPFSLRLDFNFEKKLKKSLVSPLVTKFPITIFPLVLHLSLAEILAEKIRALLTRGKGRDIFDLWFLLSKRIEIDLPLVKEKLKEKKTLFKKELLIKKIKDYPLKSLKRDLDKFLPAPQRIISLILKKELIEKLENRTLI